ncbi:hypothetical protein J1C56_01955 [Aminobacter anthyllidis]|uniref:Uncharacterized protein n=1 Tax=Aminobacter anthyllidis TaxID=1035067 RepID=A0A9X1A710_9HYPH|nr:hypothetical protein [Aminobacter anthyllidis]MBT1154348.1 hypothetical protein [Aminobacter anthyllidis]
MRLTTAQSELLEQIIGGLALWCHFDRERTVWWTLEPNGQEVSHSLVEALMTKGALLFGEPQRKPGGRSDARYVVTDRGRSGVVLKTPVSIPEALETMVLEVVPK